MSLNQNTFIFILFICFAGCAKEKWQPLFDGANLPPSGHYLGRPDRSVEVPGLKKDSLGNYLEGLGYSDPLEVFSVADHQGESVIRISGQVIGGLILADSISNFHLKLKFKWGDIKWDWMEGRPKDGGILYHQRPGFRHELQIHEGDVGSYWAKKVVLDIPARITSDLPDAILQAKPYLLPLVNTLTDTMFIFDSRADLLHFDGSGGPKDWQIVLANPYHENPHGAWNSLELICWGNHAVHIINGKVNLILLNSFYKENDELRPLNSGRLVLQSEGAEIFFKEIEIMDLVKTPKLLESYLN